MAAGARDKYANKVYGAVTESGANTLTFAEIKTNVDVFSKAAWVLHRLEYFLRAADLDLIVGNLDTIMLALTSSDKLTTIDQSTAGVIDLFELGGHFATSVGFAYRDNPVIRDFSGLPGGGIIIAPRPLYVAVKGTSLASAVGPVTLRGYFTQLQLNADEYLELVDFYRIVQ